MKPSHALPTVSVIIPTHNRAGLLRRAIDSVVTQEGVGEQFRLEVLVVDDNSTDDTPDVVRQYADVRSIRARENRGTSGARNLGLQEASGDYIAFLDDDDIWLPWKLRRQLDAFRADDRIGVVYGQEIKRSEREVRVWPEPRDAPSGWISHDLLTGCPVNSSGVLIRAESMRKAGWFDESLRCWEDYDMWMRLAFNDRFQFVTGPAVIYQISFSGRFYSSVLTGESERDLRLVVRAALDRLSSREIVSTRLREETEAAVVMRIAGGLASLQQFERQRQYLLEAVRQSPWLVRMPQLLWMFSAAAVTAGLSGPGGLDQTRDFCHQLKSASRSAGLREWLGARRVAAEVWRKAAVALSSSPQGMHGRARRLALLSLFQHPGTIGPSLLRIIIAGSLPWVP